MGTLLVNVDGIDYELASVEPPKSDRPISGFFAITPEVADAWLRNNKHNRNLREVNASAQGRDMSTKDWDVNGESIVLSRPLRAEEWEDVPEGTVVVLDGQHRLEGCAESRAPFVTNLAWGIDPATRRSIDSGAVRTLPDVLGMQGEKHSRVLGVLLRRQVMWNKGMRRFSTSSSTVTRAEMLKLLEEDPHGLRRSAELAQWITGRPEGFHFCPPGAAAQAHYLTSKIDPDQAAWFFARFRDGTELSAGHPIQTVRQRFLNDSGPRKGDAKKTVRAHQQVGYLIRGWNAYRMDEKMDRILQPAEANIPEPK